MKLKRYTQFVKKLNEEREMPEYDSVDDFRRTMGDDMEDDMEDDMGGDMRNPQDMEDDMEDDMGGDMRYPQDMEDDMGGDMEDDMGDMPQAQPERGMRGGMPQAQPERDYQTSSDEQKLHDLADMLNLEVVDNQVTYGDEVVNYYSETGNLHIGSKEFETAEDAAEYLKGGEPRMSRGMSQAQPERGMRGSMSQAQPERDMRGAMPRDTNESRSYRFKRKSRF